LRVRRPLDEEIAPVERGGAVALLAEVRRLDLPAVAAGGARPSPDQYVLERAISAVAGKHGVAEAREGVLTIVSGSLVPFGPPACGGQVSSLGK